MLHLRQCPPRGRPLLLICPYPTTPPLQLHLRRSKTDRIAVGYTINLQSINSPLCPVAALSQYLPHRLARFHQGPIFLLSSGLPLLPRQFNTIIKEAVLHAGLDPHRYSSHSFRAGAATTAAEAGLPDWMIKSMGRWASEAYHLYIRPPTESLATIPNMLLKAQQH